MADAVATVTDAPKQVIRFTQNHLIAALLLVVLLMVIFVRMETKKPGSVTGKVQKIPGVGPWATGVPNKATSPAAPS
jgi:flagellar biogenesis protein FliO